MRRLALCNILLLVLVATGYQGRLTLAATHASAAGVPPSTHADQHSVDHDDPMCDRFRK